MLGVLDIDKLILFFMFIVPGFVALKTYDLLYPAVKIDGLRRLVEAISYSCVNYAILSPFLFVYWSELVGPNKSNSLLITTGIFTLFIAPVLLTVLWKFLRLQLAKHGILNHPIGKPWDYFFSSAPSCWVTIFLKNGDVIGGYFGSNSLASSAPEPQEIFLEEAWKYNDQGGFEIEKYRTIGLLVTADVISHIEFRRYEDD